jgi:hypothetical protein
MSVPCHISHNWPDAEFELSIFSGISTLKRISETKKQVGGGIRSSVSNFSRASRKRFLEKMARCRQMDDGYFGTFTYPGEFCYSPDDCKRHLGMFRKRIIRRFPKVRVIWRMEVKPRLSGLSEGKRVPHYHLLIFGLPYGYERKLQELLGLMWDEIANYHDKDVPFLRSEVEQIRSRKQAVYYASKYVAKVDDDLDEGFGRHWGFFGEWDESASGVHRMTQQVVIQLKRLFRAHLRATGRGTVARMFAKIREDFGLSVFGLGDHDDLTGATCSILDFIIQAERIAGLTN